MRIPTAAVAGVPDPLPEELVVLDVPGDLFEEALHALVESKGLDYDTELSAADLDGLVEIFKGIVDDTVRPRGVGISARSSTRSSANASNA